MTILLITLYLAMLAFRFWLHALNVRHLRSVGHVVPAGFETAIDPETLTKASHYTLAKSKLQLVRNLFDGGLTLLFVFGGLLAWYDAWLNDVALGFVGTGTLFLLLLLLARTLLSLPFDLYSHFRIESRFGFNNMTLRLWCADQLKSLFLSLVLLGLLAAAALWLIRAAPHSWWFWVWSLLVVFALLIMVLSPYLIEPLFFTFEPLEIDALEQKIRAMMASAGLSVSKVLQVDASKRSGHSNAYFTGLGRQKRVVLFDTLLEQLSGEEILAVLAHELGHMKKKHIIKRLTLMAAIAFVICWLFYVLIGWPQLPQMAGLSDASFFARVVILLFLLDILIFPLTPLFSTLSRRDEYQADRFACDLHGKPEDLATALVRMSRENLANLHPHPFYARFYYSHPPVTERVRKLKQS